VLGERQPCKSLLARASSRVPPPAGFTAIAIHPSNAEPAPGVMDRPGRGRPSARWRTRDVMRGRLNRRRAFVAPGLQATSPSGEASSGSLAHLVSAFLFLARLAKRDVVWMVVNGRGRRIAAICEGSLYNLGRENIHLLVCDAKSVGVARVAPPRGFRVRPRRGRGFTSGPLANFIALNSKFPTSSPLRQSELPDRRFGQRGEFRKARLVSGPNRRRSC